MRIKKLSWALTSRLSPRKRANAHMISLADAELRRRRIEQEEREELMRIEARRKDIMRIVMSAKKPPEPKETTRYIVVDQEGRLVQSLEVEVRQAD